MKYLTYLLLVICLSFGVYSQQSEPDALLDLPVEVPIVKPKVAYDPPDGKTAPEEPDDDPRDTPPPIFYGEEIETETDTIFYVIDISGSMTGDFASYVTAMGDIGRGDRLDRAKAELIRSVMGLSENFCFNIISYNCGTLQWSSRLRPATQENKLDAMAWILALKSSGRTGTGPAVSQALHEKENQTVVLLTDGAPNCGAEGFEGHRRMIASNNTQGATINVFGISATGEYRTFCMNVAGDSGGSYFDVP